MKDEVYEKIYSNLDECITEVLNLCCQYANDGVEKGYGGPFGAAVIIKRKDKKYQIVSIARNTTLKDVDPTAHAEVNAIREACKKLNRLMLKDCILVSSARSCPMCLSAACWSRIPVIKYVLDYDSATNSGFIDNDIFMHLNGKKKIISEEKISGNCANNPFDAWNNKKDKTIY